MFILRKIWCALFSCYLRFEIRPFAWSSTRIHLWVLPKTQERNLQLLLKVSELSLKNHRYIFTLTVYHTMGLFLPRELHFILILVSIRPITCSFTPPSVVYVAFIFTRGILKSLSNICDEVFHRSLAEL